MDNLRAQFGSVDTDTDADFGLGEEETHREPPPSPIGQDERRMQVRAYNHWAGLLADRNLPSIEDLDPASLPDFGPHSVLLDFTNGIDDPAVRYLGSELASECDVSRHIEKLSDVPGRSLLSRITDHYLQILANQAPIGFEAEFVNQRGATIMYRGILLPYSSDDDTIDFIFGVINWKEIADQLTSDELLLEIDSALEDTAAEAPRVPDPVTDWADGPGLDEATGAPVSPLAVKPTDDRFPQPAFGAHEGLGNAFGDEEEESEDAGLYEAIEAIDDEPENASRFGSLLSLGGGKPARADFDDGDDDDFGDDDDGDDPVAKWLARPTPLRDAEHADFADAGFARDGFDEGDFVEQDFEGAPFAQAEEPLELSEPVAFDGEAVGVVADEPLELVDQAPVEEPVEATPPGFAVPAAYEPEEVTGAAGLTDEAPSGIHDCLASARELALVASTSEDRSRAALYAAVGRAYDFSLAAAAEPEEFAELMADSGLTMQERAPMTPVVKLVFGADYDKTRIAEYASVLSFAHREAIGRGELARFLANAEGGLKGVVQAERDARKSGDKATRETPREALARKLRAIAPLGFEDIPAEGEEFALVVIRRVGGEVVVLGEVAEVPLVEKVARKLVA